MTNEKKTEGANQPADSMNFVFGEPERVHSGYLSDYIESSFNGEFYEIPLNMDDLYKIYRGSVFHSSAIALKANIALSTLEQTDLMTSTDFLKFVLDFVILGNGYIERIDNNFGDVIKLKTSPALKTKVMKDGKYLYLIGEGKKHYFEKGSIFHLMQPDIKQEIYGVPEYIASMLSSELNKEATLFRLRYYLNGSHAGYIIYVTDPMFDEKDVDAIKQKLKDSKGPGNFKNLFVYAPGGNKEGIQLIPISEVAAKDEFTKIKDATREDELGMHRVPPQLIGVVPKNAAGFGAVGAASRVFARNEIQPMQARFLEINEWLGQEVFKFKPYVIEGDDTDPQ